MHADGGAFPGLPIARCNHELASTFNRQTYIMKLIQFLCCKCRPKITIPFANPLYRVSPDCFLQPPIRDASALPANQPRQACGAVPSQDTLDSVTYTHLRAHETRHDIVCRLLL